MLEILISTQNWNFTMRMDATTMVMLGQALVWTAESLTKFIFG